MPSILSVEQITDGFRVTTTSQGVVSLTTADIPNQVKRNLVTAADYENWINNTFLANKVQGFFIKVHVYSIDPMVAEARVSDDPIADGWWQ
jgi:hypothetical protein